MRMIDGNPVVDADKPVTVHITPEDCARGSKKDPEKCAAALALKRVTSCDESRVHLGCTYLRFGKKWFRYATPPSLKAEIISFDRGGGFYPGDFRLHPMPASLRLKPANPKSGHTRTRKSQANESAGEQAHRGAAAKPGKAARTAAKHKREPRVFHGVQGVRERANAKGA
jgi:hypothetical protein